jgi:hypothetical protein
MSSRTRSFLAVALAVVLALALTTGAAAAGATRTGFTASEVFVADLAAGAEFFPGGRYQLRGGVSQFRMEADDPRLDGADNVVTVNWSFVFVPEPVFVAGQMWGKFTITNTGGAWHGTWTGVRESNGFSYFHFVGTGTGGYEGMQLQMWGARETPDPTQPELYHGVIVTPAG